MSHNISIYARAIELQDHKESKLYHKATLELK